MPAMRYFRPMAADSAYLSELTPWFANPEDAKAFLANPNALPSSGRGVMTSDRGTIYDYMARRQAEVKAAGNKYWNAKNAHDANPSDQNLFNAFIEAQKEWEAIAPGTQRSDKLLAQPGSAAAQQGFASWKGNLDETGIPMDIFGEKSRTYNYKTGEYSVPNKSAPSISITSDTPATPPAGATRANPLTEEQRNAEEERLASTPEYQQYMTDFLKSAAEARTRGIEEDPLPASVYFRLKSLGKLGNNRTATTRQNPIPSNWMDVVNKEIGKKYTGATQYSTNLDQGNPDMKNGVFNPNWLNELPNNPNIYFGGVGKPLVSLEESLRLFGTGPIESQAVTSKFPIQTSPAGNNITSGVVNPTTALSGNNLATTATAPGTGTSTFGTNTSFLNPASGTVAQKRKTGANKYFNQQWFGGKQIA